MDEIGDMNQVRERLAQAGYGSVAEWAERHGHRPGTARVVVRRWGRRADRMPHGGLARQILADLQATLERVP
jgi:hypothetical protein